MPELPEVNTFQCYFDEISLNQRITEVTVHDEKILRNLSGDEFIKQLSERTFISMLIKSVSRQEYIRHLS